MLLLRFANGARPFIDEVSTTQTAAVLFSPLIRFILSYNEGNEGIVLLCRLTYLLITVCAAACFWSILISYVNASEAVLLSMLALVVIPFNIQSINYNSISLLTFSLSLFFSVNVSEKFSLYFLSAIAISLSVFVLPHLILPAAVTCFIMFFSCQRRLNCFLGLLGGFISTAIFVAPPLLEAGWERLEFVSIYLLSYGVYGRGFDKVEEIVSDFIQHLWILPLLALLTLITKMYNVKLYNSIRKYYLLAFVIAPAFAVPSNIQGSLWYTTSIALVAPIVLCWSSDIKAKQLFLKVWIPSVIGGCSTGWGSAGGGVSCGLGLFAGAIVTLIISLNWLRRVSTRSFGCIFLGAVNLLFLSFLFRTYGFFRDDNFHKLNNKVTSGPFRYLHTTNERGRFIEELTNDLKFFENQYGRIAVYDTFPAGYLFVSMPPALCTVWVNNIHYGPRKYLRESFLAGFTPYDIVLRSKHFFSWSERSTPLPTLPYDPLQDTVQQLMQKQVDKVHYEIYYGKK